MGTWQLALAGAIGVALAGCARVEPVAAWTDGSVALQATFPAAARGLRAAPAGTTRLEVRVTGAGVPDGAVLAATLTPDRTRVVFTAVPAGPKRVEARAYDAEARAIAMGGADLAVMPGATVAARIRLVPIAGDGGFDMVLE